MVRHAAVLLAIFAFAALGNAQSTTYSPRPSPNPSSVAPNPSHPAYTPPKPAAEFRNFVFNTVGPYPVAMAVFTAAIHQGTDNPPEWHQGAVGLSKRFGSNMGITAVSNATRFAAGQLLGEDTAFYRCRCRNPWHRIEHAAVSALVARKRSNGSPVFSIAGLVAPYSATMTAVYGWYPGRYGAKDAFRMGNYNLLGNVGSNLTFEFLPERVRTLLRRVHLNNRRMAD